MNADGVTCFVARDHTRQQLPYIYFDDEPGTAFSGQAAQQT